MKEIYNPFINIYTIEERYIRDFNCEGAVPSKGDIIEVGTEKYEVLKRRINYNKTPPLVSLYVSYYDL